MAMTFREALDHAVALGKAKSWRDIATRAGVSYYILQNIKQGKSEKPNAEAAVKIASVFRVTLEQFLRGELDPPEEDPALAEDVARLMETIRALKSDGSVAKIADFAEMVRLTEQAKPQKP